MKRTKFIFAMLVILTSFAQSLHAQTWVAPSAPGVIPSNAISGGTWTGGTLYVARANNIGNWNPGKTWAGYPKCNYGWGGLEKITTNFEVLTMAPGTYEWVAGTTVPANAVIAGTEGELKLCPCQGKMADGNYHPGKTWQGAGACAVGYGGQEVLATDYKTLMSKNRFQRQLMNEGRICQMLRMNFITPDVAHGYNELPPIAKCLGTLALDAAETYFAQSPAMTAEQIFTKIGTDKKTRYELTGIIYALIRAKLLAGGTDAETNALRDWVTSLYKGMVIKVAKGTLDDYLRWKANPCTYTAPGYTKPDACYNGLGVNQLFTTVKPPSDLIARSGLMFATSNTDETAAAIATGLGGISVAASVAAISTGLGINLSIVPGFVALTGLYSAFGGAVATSTAAGTSTAAIGATSWAGVVAGPVSVAVFAVVCGVMEVMEVVEAEAVEPLLKSRVGAAITQPITIENVLADPNSASLLFMAYQYAATQNWWEVPNYKIDGEVTFRCEAGYVSKFILTYNLNGQAKSFTTDELSLGEQKSFPIPAAANNITAKGIMISAGEHHVFTQNIPAPTYTCFKTYNTIFNPSWDNAWPLPAKSEVTLLQQGAFVGEFYIDYTLDGQAQSIKTGEVPGGWKNTYKLPENAKNVRIRAWGTTGLAWEPWHLTFDQTYPTAPSLCLKVYGSLLDQKWNTDCF